MTAADSVFPKYQPIQFQEYLPTECLSKQYIFQSIAQHGDFATFQVFVEPCDGTTNSMPNPTFGPADGDGPWTVTGGFSLPGSGACKANDSSSASLYKDNVFVIGNAYQIAIFIDSLVGSVQVYNGAELIQNVTALGETTFSFIAVAEDITISFDNVSHYGCIASINAYAFSPNMAFGIIDANGDTAAVVDYITSPQYFTFVNNTVTIRFQWSDFNLADECYSIGFADGCTNTNAQFGVFNQGFCSGDDGWEVDNGNLADGITFDLDGDPLECTLVVENDPVTAGAIGSITSNATDLTVGMCYEITINDANASADEIITVYCGTATEVINVSATTFPYTFQLTCTGTTVFKIEFDMQTGNLLNIFGGFQLTLCDQADYTFDFVSQSFKLKNIYECTHLLTLTCNEDALGYVFDGSGFEPGVRLVSERFDLVPEVIREFYHSNTGTKQVYYGEYRKHFNFTMENMPAWLMDFFYLCFIADDFWIDGDPFFIEGDEPSPEWAESITNFGKLAFEVSEKTQLVRNANIALSGCLDGSIQTAGCVALNDIDTGLTEDQKNTIFLIKQLKTGQDTTYETGDDGERQNGRSTSFMQLSCNNWFGNTNRFTAIDGTQTLVDDLMLDWQTGLMWYVLPFGTVATWQLANSGAEASTQAGYNDWFLPNVNELESLRNLDVSDTMSYSPLGIMSTPYANLWTSSTNPNATTEAYRMNPVNGNLNGTTKATAGIYYMICRYFTKTDLGL